MTAVQWAALGVLAVLMVVLVRGLARRNRQAWRDIRSTAGRPARDARTQHYVFAHYALRTAIMANPAEAFAALSTARGQQVIESIWNDLGAEVAKKRGGQPIPSTGLSAAVPDLAGRRCALITLPAPKGTTEAHLIAAVLNPADPAKPEDKPTVRYFTLERGLRVADNSERTVLCEWTADGKHLNHGDGPPPTKEAFLAAVRERLDSAR